MQDCVIISPMLHYPYTKNETLNLAIRKANIQQLFSGGGSDGGRKNEKYDFFEGPGSECREAEGT